jgi:hypothetical protein
MSDELTSAVALAIFIQHQKNGGKSKSQAEAAWRALRPDQRSLWRLCAKASFQAQAKAIAETKPRLWLAAIGGNHRS